MDLGTLLAYIAIGITVGLMGLVVWAIGLTTDSGDMPCRNHHPIRLNRLYRCPNCDRF
jgi:hypothetical protein